MPTSNVVLQGVDKTKSAFQSIIKNTKKTTKGAKSLLGVFRDLTVVVGGVKSAFRMTVKAMDAVVDAAARQQKAELGVLIGLARTEKETIKSFHAFRKWAAAVQEATGVGDELIFELARIGTNIGKMSREQVQDAITATLDFSQAMGVDARGAMLQLSKLLTTGVADFGRMGLVIESTGSNVEKYAEAVGKMKSGLAEMAGELPIMQLQKLKNSWGDLVESLGFLITATATWRIVVGGLTKGVGKLSDMIRDPKFIEEWGKKFDQFFLSLIEIATGILSAFLRGIQAVVSAINALGIGIGVIDWKSFLPDSVAFRAKQLEKALGVANDRLKQLKKEIQAAGGSFDATDPKVTKLAETIAIASEQLELLRAQSHKARNAAGDFADGMEAWSASMRASIEKSGVTTFESKLQGFADRAKEFMARLDAASGESASRIQENLKAIQREISDLLAFADEDTRKFMSDDAKESMLEQIEELGAAWGSSLASAMAQGIEESESIGEAFSALGEAARENFLGQMTQEAFEPLKQTFGLLAKTAALPFKIVGTVINDLILQPIAEFATKIIGNLLKGLVKIFITSKAQKAAGTAAFAAASAAFTPLLAQLTAGSVAAAISSFGVATTFGPAALAQVKAAGLSAVAGFEEGGLVFPTGNTQGRLIRVAEREPEFIVPVSKAQDFAASQIGGGGGNVIEIHIDSVNGRMNADDVDELTEMIFERMAEAGI